MRHPYSTLSRTTHGLTHHHRRSNEHLQNTQRNLVPFVRPNLDHHKRVLLLPTPQDPQGQGTQHHKGHRQGNRRDRNARSTPNETGDKMNQEEIIQDAFDQLLHEQRVLNNGSIETINHRDNSIECNLSNGWMVERVHFTSYSTGLPIVASTSVCLYDSKGELVRETIFTHENKETK